MQQGENPSCYELKGYFGDPHGKLPFIGYGLIGCLKVGLSVEPRAFPRAAGRHGSP